MEGIRGQMTWIHMLSVERDMDVIARFRIGEVSGPDSDPVTINVGKLIIHIQSNRVGILYMIYDISFQIENYEK